MSPVAAHCKRDVDWGNSSLLVFFCRLIKVMACGQNVFRTALHYACRHCTDGSTIRFRHTFTSQILESRVLKRQIATNIRDSALSEYSSSSSGDGPARSLQDVYKKSKSETGN